MPHCNARFSTKPFGLINHITRLHSFCDPNIIIYIKVKYGRPALVFKNLLPGETVCCYQLKLSPWCGQQHLQTLFQRYYFQYNMFWKGSPSACLYVCLSVCLSAYLSVCLCLVARSCQVWSEHQQPRSLAISPAGQLAIQPAAVHVAYSVIQRGARLDSTNSLTGEGGHMGGLNKYAIIIIRDFHLAIRVRVE